MNPYAVFFSALVLLGLISIVGFETLLCRLYTNYPLEWARLGAPTNMCDTSLRGIWGGSISRWRLGIRWLFRKPEWVLLDRTSYLVFVMFRWSAIVYVTGFASFPIVALLLS